MTKLRKTARVRGRSSTSPGLAERRGEGKSPARWRRRPLKIASCEVDVTQPILGDWKLLAEGLELFVKVRPKDPKGIVPVTVVLVNKLKSEKGRLRDAQTFFQPQLRVVAGDKVSAFVDRVTNLPLTRDPELRSYRLLFRHAATIGVGHGCSVEWAMDPAAPDRAHSVWTSFVPRHEVLLADTNPGIALDALRMWVLAYGDRSKVLNGLAELCSGYEDWITKRTGESRSLVGELATVADEHLVNCSEALARVKAGVRLLQADDVTWKAFQLANRAVLQVRARTVWKDNGRAPGGPDEQGPHIWRPFQLAFLLLCLKGISEPGSSERELADLLWFPTGGGKTEAYLALIAYHGLRCDDLRDPGGGARRHRHHAVHASSPHDPAVRAGGTPDLQL